MTRLSDCGTPNRVNCFALLPDTTPKFTASRSVRTAAPLQVRVGTLSGFGTPKRENTGARLAISVVAAASRTAQMAKPLPARVGGNTVRVRDADTGEERLMLEGHTAPIKDLAFSPDGSIIASASWDNTVRLWDADAGNARHTLTVDMHNLNSVAFSPDGGKLASAGWEALILWDVDTGEQLRKLHEHKGPFYSVAFSPEGSILASGGGETILIVEC